MDDEEEREGEKKKKKRKEENIYIYIYLYTCIICIIYMNASENRWIVLDLFVLISYVYIFFLLIVK